MFGTFYADQRFGEHLRSTEKNLPDFLVSEHFNTAGHFIDDAVVRGVLVLRRELTTEAPEEAPDLQTRHQSPRSLNSDFRPL